MKLWQAEGSGSVSGLCWFLPLLLLCNCSLGNTFVVQKYLFIPNCVIFGFFVNLIKVMGTNDVFL